MPRAATRSKVGVGIGPPNVPDAPKPVSSVKISRMFGAPSDAVTALGKSGLDSLDLRPMTPPKRGWGTGSTTEPPEGGGAFCASAGVDNPMQLPTTAAIATVSNKCLARRMEASYGNFRRVQKVVAPIIKCSSSPTSLQATCDITMPQRPPAEQFTAA